MSLDSKDADESDATEECLSEPTAQFPQAIRWPSVRSHHPALEVAVVVEEFGGKRDFFDIGVVEVGAVAMGE